MYVTYYFIIRRVYPQNYIPVDVFGGCGRRCPDTPDLCGKDMGQYHFYLSFENSFCTDYFTEKFFKLFDEHMHTVIPVTRSGADYDNFFPNDIFINAAKFRGADELGKHLKYLTETPVQMAKLIEAKAPYR